jgi:tyrosyl-tRNA synthetase
VQDFISELKWRGLIHDMTQGVEDHLKSGRVRAYIGFDPTAPSMTIGNYVQIMLLTFLQRAGHQPVVLLGGATGRVGDPSGKDKERDLKTTEELDRNTAFFEAQARELINFDASVPNHALIVNNLSFYEGMSVLDFLRDVGKFLTVNYMLSKESVKRRIESESGISFTEFSYQLLQGYDFVLLNRHHGVTLQMGGSDQFGNITSGVELGRKIDEAKLFAITTPLLTKSDGTKFGKSEDGNIWLDPTMTSPYKFYQFWLNSDDLDLPKFIRYFSLKTQEEIESLEKNETPQNIKRILAEEITVRIHGEAAYQSVLSVSKLLFDPKANESTLHEMDATTLAAIAKDIPSYHLARDGFTTGINVVDFLCTATDILESRSEAKRAIQGNMVSINKVRVTDLNRQISANDLLHNKYLMVESGKKNKFMVVFD